MPSDSPVAIFDSGVGGLSIYKAIKELLPNEQIIYLADGANFPYGNKKQTDVRRLTLACLKFLANPPSSLSSSFPLPTTNYKLQTKLIIVACNTATISGIDAYRRAIPHLPIIGVVPVVKTASCETKNGRIAIISTVATANSTYQKKLISLFCPGFRVFNLTSTASLTSHLTPTPLSQSLILNIGCRNLVTYIEKGITEGPEIEDELHQILKPVINAQCDILVLGCTHYPFLKPTIQKIFLENSEHSVNQKFRKSDVRKIRKFSDFSDVSDYSDFSDNSEFSEFSEIPFILDSGAAIARHAKRILEQNRMLTTTPKKNEFSSGEFLTTGSPEKFRAVIKKLLKIDTQVKHVSI